jgi:hypothetical protein
MRPTTQHSGISNVTASFLSRCRFSTPQPANCALAYAEFCLFEKLWYTDHCDAPSAGAIKTTESPGLPSASIQLQTPCTSPTSYEQHLALLLDRPYAGLLLVILFLCNIYGFFYVSENEVAMRVVCLNTVSAWPSRYTSYSFATYM